MKLRLLTYGLSLVLGSNLFAAPKQLTGQHAPATTPALSPADAQKAFKTLDGFEARLFAAEPDVVNPVAMTWDERGRLWVVELYEYPLGAPAGQKPRDQIKILEDTDNDGRADKVKVFADGLNLATGILIGNGGVYVGQAPELLFLEDTNGDDVADKRTVLLTGFGLQDRHELLNGFTWGPDGWLYMTHGVFTFSKVRIPEATTPGVEMTAAVARYNPVTKKFEVFAEGTSNPWGVDFDKYGNAFVSACVIDHLFHMAPGGIYQRQAGTPANPYVYELLPSIVDHKHHMAAYCGINVYQGDQYPEEFSGRVFMGNIHQNALNHDRLIPNGSSFKAVAEPEFLSSSDGWFRPVVENVGPDGAVWVADWYDKYPCYQNAQADPEGVDRAYGRIWRVVYTGNKSGTKVGSRPDNKMDLKKLKDAQLVKLLEHSNVWHRRTAQRLLAERSDRNPAFADRSGLGVVNGLGPVTHDSLEQRVRNGGTTEVRLAALWTLHQIGRTWKMETSKGVQSWTDKLLEFAEVDDAAVRSWAVKFLGEDLRRMQGALAGTSGEAAKELSVRAMGKLEKLASDSNPSVRLAVAIACRQIVSSSLTINTDINTAAPIGKILSALVKSSADAKDPLIPYMIWLASEPLLAANPEPGLKWLAENASETMPLSGILARKSLRRICDTGDAAKMDQAVAFLSAAWGKNDDFITAALDGLIEGQKAKPLRPTVDTQTLLAKANESASPKIKDRLQQLGALWGDAAASESTLALINDANANEGERIKAIQAAKQLKNNASREALLKLITSGAAEPLVREALQSFGAIADDASASQLVKNWGKLSPNLRRVAAETLISRSHWGRMILDGLEDKTIAPADISATVARSLFTSKNPNFVARAERLLGRYREADADKLKVIAAKRTLVLSGQPNMKNGYEVTKRSCLVCHKLLGEGADVGPDLTGVGRSTLDALLANVIDPNQVIGIGYENVEIETKDGRIVAGRMVENTDSHVKLLAAGPTENVVAKSDIESMRVSELSVMPEGLEQMPEDDFRDMIWYILAPPQEGELTPDRRKALVGK